MQKISWRKLKNENLKGKVFLLPTDTVYGFHALVWDGFATQKLKNLKERENENFVILISSISEIETFGIDLKKRHIDFLKKIWPGPFSVVFEKNGKTFCFRMPKKRALRGFLKKQGAVYSTSANKHGEKTIISPKYLDEKQKEQVSFFIDEGKLKNEPSTILKIVR